MYYTSAYQKWLADKELEEYERLEAEARKQNRRITAVKVVLILGFCFLMIALNIFAFYWAYGD